ncbi:hypothetical protein HKD37_18G050204 [Glycine soja]
MKEVEAQSLCLVVVAAISGKWVGEQVIPSKDKVQVTIDLRVLESRYNRKLGICQDVLTTVIRRPVHIGCVLVAGANVTTRQYFGQASTGSHTSTSISPKELDQMKQNIKEELTQNIKDKLKQSITVKVTRQLMLSFSQMQSRESYIQLSQRHGLYVTHNPPRLIALGIVYEGSTTAHHVPLGNDMVKDKQVPKRPIKPADRSEPDVNLIYQMALMTP